ncbi:MAG: VWA domain-containing protein [Acidobacteria bacterium]|nr:VWA domain-containing protein [Acidobacteriota bacterium]
MIGPSAGNLPPAHTSPTPSPTPKVDPDDIIKVTSNLVPIPVSVDDPSGRAVANLKLSDFELKVDGKPIDIDDMFRSEAPIRLAMLFDNSSSVLVARDFERAAAVRFFKKVVRPDRDLAALFSVADTTRLEQPLTQDVASLTRAIDAFPEPGGATALLDGIIRAADYLRLAEGRRVIVIVSDGEDTYSEESTTLEMVVHALQVANCQVFVMKTKDFENYKLTGVRGGNANIRALTAERRMIEITQQTGGAVYSPIDESEMNAAFADISAELSQQYVLSYYPESDAEHRGEFRSITVTIKGKPDLSVRTRKGYYVPKR